MDSSKLIFIDETSINTSMTRLYGRAEGGDRVIDYIPDVRFERTSIVSSVRLDGTITSLAFEGSLNGDIFLCYVKQFLVPTLREGDIVIMDNLSSHKVKGIEAAIEAVGAYVLFLPAHSPDLNPIEQMWSKVKACLRKAKARTADVLFEALKNALDAVSAEDVRGWFGEAGYFV